MSQSILKNAGYALFAAAVLSATLATPALAGKPGGETPQPPSCAQNWDRNFSGAERYTILAEFDNEAVRDNNTCLVWERYPTEAGMIWTFALNRCAQLQIGDTRGWRLPSLAELTSLQDLSLAPSVVPADVFPNVVPYYYWTGQTILDATFRTYGVNFNGGGMVSLLKAGTENVWCVRGPAPPAAY
jgi:Protein of unknown function (DUF1566)